MSASLPPLSVTIILGGFRSRWRSGWLGVELRGTKGVPRIVPRRAGRPHGCRGPRAALTYRAFNATAPVDGDFGGAALPSMS
jgi:hypothetical protein